MPDDFVLNVRQISQYAQQPAVGANANVLVQLGGMGGPYGSVAADILVSTALANQGSMTVGGLLAVNGSLDVGSWAKVGGTLNVGSWAQVDGTLQVNGFAHFLEWLEVDKYITAADITVGNASFDSLAVGGQPIAMLSDVRQLAATSVRSVAGRTGAVMLSVDDVMGAAPLHAPFFGGTPRANTPWDKANSSELVTAEWVRNFFLNGNAVASFNGRRGAVRLRLIDMLEAGGAPIHSPEFVGRPRAPTPPGWDSSDRLATTRFVQWAITEGGWQGPVGPPGPKGPPGTGFNFRGTVATQALLPMTGNEVSDLFIAADTNVGYVWDGAAWQPIGMITPSARVYVADNAPLVANDGDLWFSSATGDLWVYYVGPSGGQWVIANAGVEGPQGPEGLQGPPGPNVSIGTTAPVGPTAGQLWFNPSTGNTQLWDGTQWLPVSEPSATVTVGIAPPASAVEGDLWFDTSSTGELMVFMQGVWVAAASGIEGPQGPAGATGPQGTPGLQGVQGPPGTGIQFRGDQPTLADIQALPSPNQGDAWVDLSTGDLWVWNGSAWTGPYPFGGGISEAPTPGIYGRENGGWTQLLDDGVF